MSRLPYTRAGAAGPLTVALYARVSTNRGEQDPDNQLIQFRDYCGKRGWAIGAEYVDHVSAKNSTDRKQFQQLFKDAAKRRFDLVLFWSLDRFSREGTYPTLVLLQRLDSYGVAWKSLTEEYLDSCGMFKDVVIAMLSTLAKQERLRISERVRAGVKRVRDLHKEGKPAFKRLEDGSLRPYTTWGCRPLELQPIPEGLSERQAAKLLGVSKTTIRRRRKLSHSPNSSVVTTQQTYMEGKQ